MASPEAKNLEAISKAIDQHNSSCPFPAAEVRMNPFEVVKRHYQVIVAVGGVILIAMGILIWTDELTRINAEVQSWLTEIGLDFWNF